MFAALTKQLLEHVNQLTSQPLSEQDQQTLHALIQSSLAKANLVTREEFDSQCKVLERTRQKIEALEKQLAKTNHDA